MERGDRALTFANPVIFADVPDPDVVYDDRHGPILDDTDALALRNGENTYGQGSWAASIR
jgi:hypothetical protein